MKKRYSIIILGLIVVLAMSGCGGSSSGSSGSSGTGGVDVSSLSEDEQEAYNDAGDLSDTFTLCSSSGSVSGLTTAMTTAFPKVTTLLNGGDDVITVLEQTFSGSKDFDDDMQLSIFAYVLERQGDSGSLSTLREFLGDNLTSDLYMSPHFISHAIEVLSNTTNVEPTYYYDLSQMISLSSGSGSINVLPDSVSLKTDFGTRPTCVRQYIIVDSNGDPLTYIDANGDVKDAVIRGTEFKDVDPPTITAEGFRDSITAANGAYYVNDNSEFVGQPSKQFNCAGYAFRDFNRGLRWIGSPTKIYDVLIRAGLLTSVTDSNAQVGDKVFYFEAGKTLPGHVAEVSDVQSGLLSNTITVRNANHQSGLFRADIDAAYYDPYYESRRIYRWTSGSAPTVIPDPAIMDNEAYCDYRAPSDSSFFATISIPGFNLTFTPQTVAGSNTGSASGGGVTVTALPGITAGEGTTSTFLQNELIMLLFDRRQISAAGTYTANDNSEVFRNSNGAVGITYSGPNIVNEDDNSFVVFSSIGGNVILTSYGESLGDRLTGTFAIRISGARITSADGKSSQTHYGSMVGGFDVEIE